MIRDGKPSLVFSLSINRLDVEDDLSVEEMKKIVLTQSPRTQTPGGHTLFIILLSTYLEYGICILLAFQLLHQFISNRFHIERLCFVHKLSTRGK